MEQLIGRLIASPGLHARFLNTLSFMENCGARKISAYEDRRSVTVDVLDHAWEEKRHAYILKHQLRKIPGGLACADYRPEHLIGSCYSKHYLDRLDVRVCRLLKRNLGLAGRPLKDAAYLLVTYAIEVRALALYPAYQQRLRQAGSRVSVHLIYREETEHLRRMEAALADSFQTDASGLKQSVEAIETELFDEWYRSLQDAVEVEERFGPNDRSERGRQQDPA